MTVQFETKCKISELLFSSHPLIGHPKLCGQLSKPQNYFQYNDRHQCSSRHRTHKAFTVSRQRERFCATSRILIQVKCTVSSFFLFFFFNVYTVDGQVALGLPCCLFPSGVQSRPSLAMFLRIFSERVQSNTICSWSSSP